MYVGEVEVTLREAIFSVTIASVLFLIGFLISTKIEHSVNQRNLEYRQAAQITETNEFAQAIKTDVGNAFVQGKWVANAAVEHPKLKGEWARIHADYQEYRMHTRVETYTTYDSKGRPHTHTRTVHYWSWDTYKTSATNSPTVTFMGVTFPFKKFNYDNVGRKYETVGNGFEKRIEFTMIPLEFNAAAYTKLENNTVSDNTALIQDGNIAKMYERYTDSCALFIFWILWSLLMVGAVVVFVCIDNRWIEDNPDGIKDDPPWIKAARKSPYYRPKKAWPYKKY